GDEHPGGTAGIEAGGFRRDGRAERTAKAKHQQRSGQAPRNHHRRHSHRNSPIQPPWLTRVAEAAPYCAKSAADTIQQCAARAPPARQARAGVDLPPPATPNLGQGASRTAARSGKNRRARLRNYETKGNYHLDVADTMGCSGGQGTLPSPNLTAHEAKGHYPVAESGDRG